jgi:hypothetical protein
MKPIIDYDIDRLKRAVIVGYMGNMLYEASLNGGIVTVVSKEPLSIGVVVTIALVGNRYEIVATGAKAGKSITVRVD